MTKNLFSVPYGRKSVGWNVFVFFSFDIFYLKEKKINRIKITIWVMVQHFQIMCFKR